MRTRHGLWIDTGHCCLLPGALGRRDVRRSGLAPVRFPVQCCWPDPNGRAEQRRRTSTRAVPLEVPTCGWGCLDQRGFVFRFGLFGHHPGTTGAGRHGLHLRSSQGRGTRSCQAAAVSVPAVEWGFQAAARTPVRIQPLAMGDSGRSVGSLEGTRCRRKGRGVGLEFGHGFLGCRSREVLQGAVPPAGRAEDNGREITKTPPGPVSAC